MNPYLFPRNTMDNYPDRVFMLLAKEFESGMPILEWAIDHFDSNITMFILTPDIGDPYNKYSFKDTAEKYYLPKCAQRKFKAEILLPQGQGQGQGQNGIYQQLMLAQVSNSTSSIWELLGVNGMRNFVISAQVWNYQQYQLVFDMGSNNPCNIWIVNQDKTVASVRGQGAISHIIRENAQHELEKRKLLSQIKQVEELQRINEQKWNNMKESIKKEKEAAITTIRDRLDSLQSDYIKIQDERDIAVEEAEKLRNQIKYLAQTSDFTWQELKNATRDFSELSALGEGGYGRVYRGDLRGTEVAIKILNSQSTIPLSGFKQEVAILTMVRHPNLVTLIGACHEASALVYEFLPNGSLENYLNHTNNITPLTWQVRTRIICEICLALIFLHSNKPNMVIHGDLKPDNVLLDANFVSKLADFGISRLIKQSDTMTTPCYVTYNPIGTPGYMDPEFVNTGELTEKSDVFSFGVIILRLLTGKPARGVVYGVQEAMESETFHTMIDASAGEWPVEQAKELGLLGLRCAEIRRKDRPSLFNEVWPVVERLRANM